MEEIASPSLPVKLYEPLRRIHRHAERSPKQPRIAIAKADSETVQRLLVETYTGSVPTSAAVKL